MLDAVFTTLPILLALAAGYILGLFCNDLLRRRVAHVTGYAAWVLLFALGAEFGSVLNDPTLMGHALQVGLVFALCCTLATWLLILGALPSNGISTTVSSSSAIRGLLNSAKGCVATLVLVALGTLATQIPLPTDGLWLPSIGELIWALVFLVGIELSGMRFDRDWITPRTLGVPLVAVVGTLIGGILAAWLMGEPMKIGLVIASGLGWISLSSAMVGEALGERYASMVLIADLLRELIAITLLYLAGMRAPLACIGAAGVTSLDTTLPIVRVTCPEDSVRCALVSGLILTLLSPVLIAVSIAM